MEVDSEVEEEAEEEDAEVEDEDLVNQGHNSQRMLPWLCRNQVHLGLCCNNPKMQPQCPSISGETS